MAEDIITQETTSCGRCREVLSIESFNWANRKARKRSAWCRSCEKEYRRLNADRLLPLAREWKAKHRERHLAMTREWHHRTQTSPEARAKRRQYTRKYNQREKAARTVKTRVWRR